MAVNLQSSGTYERNSAPAFSKGRAVIGGHQALRRLSVLLASFGSLSFAVICIRQLYEGCDIAETCVSPCELGSRLSAVLR
jgi:hypothetical protein